MKRKSLLAFLTLTIIVGSILLNSCSKRIPITEIDLSTAFILPEDITFSSLYNAQQWVTCSPRHNLFAESSVEKNLVTNTDVITYEVPSCSNSNFLVEEHILVSKDSLQTDRILESLKNYVDYELTDRHGGYDSLTKDLGNAQLWIARGKGNTESSRMIIVKDNAIFFFELFRTHKLSNDDFISLGKFAVARLEAAQKPGRCK